jgi:predicted GNAT family N-acyltransferase
MNNFVRLAKSETDLNKIIQLRYDILRKSWQQPIETATDELESQSYNALLENENGEMLACGRLQINANQIGQIRYMAVATTFQGKSYGEQILKFLETQAKQLNLKSIELQARENAVSFYKKNGYEIKEKSFLLWGTIQHYLMVKEL